MHREVSVFFLCGEIRKVIQKQSHGMRVTLQQGRAISSGCSLRTHTGPRCHERLGTRSHRPAASGISTWSYYCNMNCVESMAGTRESLFHYRITRKLVKGPALHTQYTVEYICKKPCAVDIKSVLRVQGAPQAAFVSNRVVRLHSVADSLRSQSGALPAASRDSTTCDSTLEAVALH